MKKSLVMLLLIFLFPISVFSYSNYLIPGGESIGIKINTDGLVVIGYYKVGGEYIAKNNIKIGDIITKVNNQEINDISELSHFIDDSVLNNKKVDIEINRNGYGALGHEIRLNESNEIVKVKKGNILESYVNGIDKSRNGYVGSKNASISYGDKIGNIKANTNKGIFGNYTKSLPNKDIYEVASFDEIKKDTAYIFTVTKGNKIEKYKIRINDKFYNRSNTQKAFSYEIVDSKLLSKTGGIIQGMSGSPIIQYNRIIGAVTNVVVDNVKIGYGISIISMLEESEKELK